MTSHISELDIESFATVLLGLTVRRSGQMILTQAAVDLFGDEVAFVQIGYNAATKAVGLRSVAEGGSGRYRLRHQKNSRHGSSTANGSSPTAA